MPEVLSDITNIAIGIFVLMALLFYLYTKLILKRKIIDILDDEVKEMYNSKREFKNTMLEAGKSISILFFILFILFVVVRVLFIIITSFN